MGLKKGSLRTSRDILQVFKKVLVRFIFGEEIEQKNNYRYLLQVLKKGGGGGGCNHTHAPSKILKWRKSDENQIDLYEFYMHIDCRNYMYKLPIVNSN